MRISTENDFLGVTPFLNLEIWPKGKILLKTVFLSETDKRFAILDILNPFSKRFASVGFGISNFGALP